MTAIEIALVETTTTERVRHLSCCLGPYLPYPHHTLCGIVLHGPGTGNVCCVVCDDLARTDGFTCPEGKPCHHRKAVPGP